MDYEQAKERLIKLMATNDGNLTAGIVEQDPELAANRDLVSAAARELASEPDVIVGAETDARDWFPYSFLIRQ
jgi:hypothetical protein